MARAARVKARAAALLALACAATPRPDGETSAAPGLTAQGMASRRLAVLPLGTLLLPAGAAPRDSLAAALSRRVDAGLSTALEQTGAAGSVRGPAALAATLTALGPDALRAIAAAADSARPDGRLPESAAEDLVALADATGVDLFLLPRALAIVAAGPLRYEGRLTAVLIDPGAGRVVWSATIRAVSPTPPPGDAPDLAAAAMENATDAALQALATRLSRLGEEPAEPDEVPEPAE